MSEGTVFCFLFSSQPHDFLYASKYLSTVCVCSYK
jgi:hypothetical protein